MKTLPIVRNLIPTITVAIIAAVLGSGSTARAVLPHKDGPSIAEVDVRESARQSPPQSASRHQAATALKRQLRGAEVTFDGVLGTPKYVRSSTGFLTGPNGVGKGVSASVRSSLYQGEQDRALRLFLDEHADLFGFGANELQSALKTRDAVDSKNGMRTMVWEQQIDGLPVFESKLVANITKNGELVAVSSRIAPNINAGSSLPGIHSDEAIARAFADMGEPLQVGEQPTADASRQGSPFAAFKVRSHLAHARLVWLPVDSSNTTLAWEIYLTSSVTRHGYQVLVNANTGETLVRKDLTCYISDATYNVYTSDSPSPFTPSWPEPNTGQPPLVSRTLVTTNAFSVLASPNGWIDDGVNETRGNNADAFLDRDFDAEPDGGARPQGNPDRVFDFELDLSQDPVTYSNAAVVQMFYHVNAYHDWLYELGFTEEFGNYQRNNFGRGGFGNDEILCHVQAAADLGAANNAFFQAAPDGINGRIAMFVWSFPTPERDGDLDAEVIYHEATHGTSWRLVGGGMGLGNLQGNGMGEGWSDFYAMCLLGEPDDDPDAVYAYGGYPTYLYGGLTQNYYFGIRHFPYSTDMTKNPFTYKDIDPTQISAHAGVPRSPVYPFNTGEASEVHHQGEVWCSMLWEVRANLIRKLGAEAGNSLVLQLVTDGMKLTPASPTYVEARDAILLADQVLTGGANANEIWRGFAKRGLGVGATSPDSDTTTGVVESYSIPGLQLVDVSVLAGNDNGVIDPDECNDLFVTLTNASGAAATGVTLTLSSSTPGVYVIAPTVTIPVFPVGAIYSNLGPFEVSITPDFVCGTTVDFELAVKSNQGANTNKFDLDTGVLGLPIEFNSELPVAIPDNSSAGANSPITVTNLTGPVGKVVVKLFIEHTFDSDLTLELISPDGTTNLLAGQVGGSGNNFGTGCSVGSVRTTFDDDATVSITAGTPPFAGVFKPQMPLSVFKGKTAEQASGVWQLRVVDDAALDVGVIQCWSLTVYPSECEEGGGQCPGADLVLNATDFPDPVVIGSNLVYSLKVTNGGPNTAKGTVLVQNLPSSVVFVSATTTLGNVAHAAGVVTANLGNMPIQSVATVTVTVLPLSAGSIVSTASVSSTEPEINPANNSVNITTLVQNPSADLSVTLQGLPNPSTVGGMLTYTATVNNKGPSTATGVVITNTLPASVQITSATSSQGSVSINGNTVVCIVGTINNGATVTATINTVPLSAGTVFATARVTGNLADPVQGNNVATISTVVGEAADLGITLVDLPDPVVIGSNFNYVVTITNRGPNAATSVVVNQSLGSTYNLVGSSATQGSVTPGSSSVFWSVGTLAAGATASMTLTGNSAVAATLNSSASVNASQADPNVADNTAAASTLVSPPFVSIVGAGASLLSESLTPANGAVDLGENVTVALRLRNAGNIANTNVVATLLATGGVTSPSGSQVYGSLPPGGLSESRNFTFTAAGTNGGVVTATLQITDGGNSLSNVTFQFPLARQFAFTNPASITIPDSGSATPYPSTIVVSGVTGTVGQVTATLRNMSHTFLADVDVLLVGPAGQKAVLMGSAGNPFGATDATVTFSDSASTAIPQSSAVVSGSYKPANYNPSSSFGAPAPAGPYSSSMSAFADANPNGTWSLYVVDRNSGDQGVITSGWSLGLSMISPVNQISDLSIAGTVSPNPGLVGNDLVWQLALTNKGPALANSIAVTNTLSANLALQSATSSAGIVTTNSNQVICNVGSLSSNGVATVTIVARPTSAGAASVSASAHQAETDLNQANNTVTIVATNSLPFADMAVGIQAAPAPAIVGSNLVLSVAATNNGSGKALGATVLSPLAAGASFQSASVSKGSFTVSNNIVVCAFGDLVSGEAVSAEIVVRPLSSGSLTNQASASSGSTDTNSANNVASAVVNAVAPQPIIVAGSARMISESQNPANGAIEPGETVTVELTLSNTGQLPTTNLTATLQASGGVNLPSGPQNYGAIASGGGVVSRQFTFTAPNTVGATITATLNLSDNGAVYGPVTFVFGVSSTTSFANTSAITISESGPGSPYPSIIQVTGVEGVVGKVSVTLSNFAHSYPADVDAMLVGPQGQKILLMSDVGAGYAVSNLTLVFDDGAASSLPSGAALTSGVFKPTDFEAGDVLPAPAPAGERATQLTTFNNTDPNGNWQLYVADDLSGDGGVIASGWSLNFTIVEPISPLANIGIVSAVSSPATIYPGDVMTYTIQITNRGPAGATSVVLANNLTGVAFDSAVASQGTYTVGTGLVTFELGDIGADAGAVVTLNVKPAGPGTVENNLTLAGAETDLDASDNAAQVLTAIQNAIPALLSGSYDTTNRTFEVVLTGQPGATYVFEGAMNLGAWTALSTNTAPGNGIIKFTDGSSSGLSLRFYRAVRQTP